MARLCYNLATSGLPRGLLQSARGMTFLGEDANPLALSRNRDSGSLLVDPSKSQATDGNPMPSAAPEQLTLRSRHGRDSWHPVVLSRGRPANRQALSGLEPFVKKARDLSTVPERR